LGDLVAQLEGGGLGLSESIAAYEQGVALLRQLHATLETAEQKVQLLTGIAADGTPALEPWPAADAESRTATGAGMSSAARGATNRSKRLPGMDGASGAV
jgi:exodeoxyribonuclease VII small subunit